LPRLKAGGGVAVQDYDLARRERHQRARGQAARGYLNNVLEIDRAAKLTGHDARPHSERDLRDFALLREGESSASAMRVRNMQFEFPYDKTHFKDRYTRQSRWKPCSTIVAHLSKDGLMFIHPTQNRSLTPRETARVQSFPDWFVFPKSRTHAYRLIGNAVPPLVAEAVGLAVLQFLDDDSESGRRLEGSQHECDEMQESKQKEYFRHYGGRSEAIFALRRFAKLDRAAVHMLKREELLAGWYALLYLFPDLHPDNALDHGERVEVVTRVELDSFEIEELFARRYARSGWPVVLAPLGREIWRRFEKGQLTYSEVYCSDISATKSQNEEENRNAARSEGA
jgi:DNA (cytosine-5)-methyltransferase 1